MSKYINTYIIQRATYNKLQKYAVNNILLCNKCEGLIAIGDNVVSRGKRNSKTKNGRKVYHKKCWSSLWG